MNVYALSCRNAEENTGWRCGGRDVNFLSCVCRLSTILKLGKGGGKGRDFQDEGVKDKQSQTLGEVVRTDWNLLCRYSYSNVLLQNRESPV